MLVHILLLFIICVWGFVYYSKGPSKKKNKQFLIVSFSTILIVASLRGGNVGWDTANYERGFYVLNNNVGQNAVYYWTATHWEYGWQMINKFVGLFTDNPQIFLFFVGLLIYFNIAIYIYYNTAETASAFWPVFLFMTMSYLYPSSMNLMRQFLAISIAINIITVLRNGKTKKRVIIAIALLLVAFEVHHTAILYIIVLILYLYDKPSKRLLLYAGVGAVGAFILFPIIINYWLKLFPQYGVFLSVGNEYYEGFGFSAYNLVMCMIRILFVILICGLDNKDEKNKQLYYLAFLNIIATGFTLLTMRTALAVRMSYYFDMFIIMIIPQLINKFRTGKSYVYMTVLVLGWAFFIFELFHEAKGTVPYYFFWQ